MAILNTSVVSISKWAGCSNDDQGASVSYIVWALLGIVIAVLIGAGPRRRAFRPNANAALFAGAFGGVIGGVIGDGVPHALAGDVTIGSVVGAIAGAVVFAWAVRDRTSDSEP